MYSQQVDGVRVITVVKITVAAAGHAEMLSSLLQRRFVNSLS